MNNFMKNIFLQIERNAIIYQSWLVLLGRKLSNLIFFFCERYLI